MDLGERAEALARDLIGPMLTGGQVSLQRPFGAKLSAEIGQSRQVVDDELRTNIDNARLRQARRIVAVDVLPPLSPPEWTLSAALNDLLQTTNHELSSFVTRGRHLELVEATRDLIGMVPPCKTLQELVCRYATFSRAPELTRIDTKVSWWTGSSAFRGQEPPARLMAWPGLRNVRVDRQRIILTDMDEGVALPDQIFDAVLNHWFQQSPLLDIAYAARPTPKFVWTAHAVSAISSVAGCNLALRAVTARGQSKEVAEVLAKSAAQLPAEARQWPEYLVQQIRAADAAWAAE